MVYRFSLLENGGQISIEELALQTKIHRKKILSYENVKGFGTMI